MQNLVLEAGGGGRRLRGKQGIYVGNAMVENKRPTFSCKKNKP